MFIVEREGHLPEKLQVLGSDRLRIGNRLYSVHDTGVDETPGEGVHVDVIAFDEPEVARWMDAALISIEPGCATPVQHWIGSRMFIETAIKGKGTWVGVNQSGEVVSFTFDSRQENQGVIFYGPGWIGSWVAGEEGLQIIEVCIPPYEDDGTTLVAGLNAQEIEGAQIPADFWDKYSLLMGLERPDLRG